MPAPENTTYIIQHKTTKEKYKASSGKSSWKKPQHAKAAFLQSYTQWDDSIYVSKYKHAGLKNDWYIDLPRLSFNDQDVYEIIELKSKDSEGLTKAKELLTSCLGRLKDNSLEKEVEDFLNNN
jgi:hypothetical protein